MEMPRKGWYGVKVFAQIAKRAGEWKNVSGGYRWWTKGQVNKS